MLILVTLDVGDHLAGRHHLLVTGQIVEEGERAVEENPFQDKISHQCVEKSILRRRVTELLIDVGDELVALQQHRIMLPIFKNLLLLAVRHNR
ncbi:hypothetical protein D3C85_1234550 [compost metagenome]